MIRHQRASHDIPGPPQMASNEEGQNLPDRCAGHTFETPNRGHWLAGLCAQHALAVIVHVQRPLPASRAEGWPIAVGVTDAPLVRGMAGDIFGDQRAALLSGRTQPKKRSEERRVGKECRAGWAPKRSKQKG